MAVMAAVEEAEAELETEPERCCEHCGSESLRLTHECPKRSWSEILGRDSECSPGWYRESQKLDEIRFWDDSMGEGFSEWYEWYLKSGIESAGESPGLDAMTETAAETGMQQRMLF
ncbi:hypothetical protein Enr13x_71860 [Stieleria neptunia]|uniref:Uncharacterized protein n=2 Tax=Stieleria neptunia TaxID=2527979 RepID=A0A518I2N4_9BACT|nr:hypothetical protein Enr13x_71860 [Stieleria neptunia]